MQLSLSLLGPYKASLDGRPLTGLYSSKVRGLLAYLAVESGRPHMRTMLAALLWPDWSDSAALGNLRFSLSKLRQAIHDQAAAPAFLAIKRDTIQIDPEADFCIDVRAFEGHIASSRWQQSASSGGAAAAEVTSAAADMRQAIDHLETAVALYRGAFLEGFSVGDSPTFEEWARYTRERFEQAMLAALRGLTSLHRRLGDYEAAERSCRHLLSLDAWDEEANASLMSVLSQSGRRPEALRHYAAFRAGLLKELGAEPSEATTSLYERLRHEEERMRSPRQPLSPAPPTEPGAPTADHAPPAAGCQALRLLAREAEVARLDTCLESALTGRGHIVFVSGEAGSGKTALISEFARRAAVRYPAILVATGQCNAFAGAADPYLPFREISQVLVGDIDPQPSGEANAEYAWPLGSAPSGALGAWLDARGEMLARFAGRGAHANAARRLTGEDLQALAAAWQTHIAKPKTQGTVLEHGGLFSQYTAFLLAVAAWRPLLLILDDLQWADTWSLSLLFHLGRRLNGAKILIIGAYRPEELCRGVDAGRAPLVAVVNELRRAYGDIEIELNQADGRRFVSDLLDALPNRLDGEFRETLFHHTGGQPLFTIELLRGLRDRNELAQDADGKWVETGKLDWRKLPPRVEAVIAQRVDRLQQCELEQLAAGSVEGEEFTAEVVARVVGRDAGDVRRSLSGALSSEHRLVHGAGLVHLDAGSHMLSRYRFKHALVQEYLYDRLDPVARAHLHGQVASALEELYDKRAADVAVQLAWHFDQAGMADKAVDYLIEAGRQAMLLAAHVQAAADFNRGLALLAMLPETDERSERKLRLRLALNGPLLPFRRPAEVVPLTAAHPHGEDTGLGAMYALLIEASNCRERGDFEQALSLSTEMLGLAARDHDRQNEMLAHFVMGSTAQFSGDLILSRTEFETVLALYDHRDDRWLVTPMGVDVRAATLGYLAITLWLLGYPDEAGRRGAEAVEIGERLGQAATMVGVLTSVVWLAVLSRNRQSARHQIEKLVGLTGQTKTRSPELLALVQSGALLAEMGQHEEGLARIRHGLAEWTAPSGRHFILLTLAEQCLRAGQNAEARQAVDDALAGLQRGLGRNAEAELHRLAGALTLARGLPGDATLAEAHYRKAISVAREQQSRSWELRASIDLTRLWQQQAKTREAYELLSVIYGWFTEGFGTPDLHEAKSLLEELPGRSSARNGA